MARAFQPVEIGGLDEAPAGKITPRERRWVNPGSGGASKLD
ncbi:MAG: hypothetical protein NTW86_16545 [Candidatus Sumerlaeota bacterium]|nr:hypothetical protein [Candidatus Sumerlaeota bacterium]